MDAAGSMGEMRFWGGDGAPEAAIASVLWGIIWSRHCVLAATACSPTKRLEVTPPASMHRIILEKHFGKSQMLNIAHI